MQHLTRQALLLFTTEQSDTRRPDVDHARAYMQAQDARPGELHQNLGLSPQHHARHILRRLPLSHVPDLPAYQVPKEHPRFSNFPPIAPKESGTKRAWSNHMAEMKHLAKTLHFMRRIGHAVGGKHNEAAERHGVFSMHFGHDGVRSRDYMNHINRELPKTVANAIRHERGGHEGSHTHRIEVDHDELHRAIQRHRAGVEEALAY